MEIHSRKTYLATKIMKQNGFPVTLPPPHPVKWPTRGIGAAAPGGNRFAVIRTRSRICEYEEQANCAA